MVDVKRTVFSLNVLGPMGDSTQEFQIGTNDNKTVIVQIGTIFLSDDGKGKLLLNGKGTYTSDDIDMLMEDIIIAMEEYTNQAVSTISSFQILIVDELPVVGESGYIYFVPKKTTPPTGYYEYIYINNKWEWVGDTNFDIADYYTADEIDSLFMPKTGGTFTGGIKVEGDITVQRIKFGDAMLTLSVDPLTDKTTITIDGGTIYLTGNVCVNGNIYQESGIISQTPYIDNSNV